MLFSIPVEVVALSMGIMMIYNIHWEILANLKMKGFAI